jgi:hypothetical protein
MTEAKVHGNTRKAAEMALARRQISRHSHRAVHEGRIRLAHARELGRDRGPHDAGQASSGHEEGRKAPREGSQERSRSGAYCLCGCEEPVRGKKSRFRPGHDSRLYGELKRNLEKDPLLRNERFTDEQKAYARERGLI